MKMDLTTQLNNFALTCEGKSRECRKRVDEIGKIPPAANFPEYNRMHIELPAKQATAEAAAWDRRAVEARRGFLLYDQDDIAWHMDHAELVAMCQKACRITYVDPVANPASPVPPRSALNFPSAGPGVHGSGYGRTPTHDERLT